MKDYLWGEGAYKDDVSVVKERVLFFDCVLETFGVRFHEVRDERIRLGIDFGEYFDHAI